MNSRWQANKIGLINFWYYDEQEFPFVKGRILLRGSNGSGKSVTSKAILGISAGNAIIESGEIIFTYDGAQGEETVDLLKIDDQKMQQETYLIV